MTTERIQELRLKDEEFDERWAMADVADAQFDKVLQGLAEILFDWDENLIISEDNRKSKPKRAQEIDWFRRGISATRMKIRDALEES